MISRRRFVLTTAAFAGSSPPALSESGAFAFVDTNLIPMNEEKVVNHQTVVVRNGRIETVGPLGDAPIPEDATQIDSSGLYLMPGLADMHCHMNGSGPSWDNDLFLYVANGVTMVREMWATVASLRYRYLQLAGSIIAPRMILASPGMDGPQGRYAPGTPPVTSEAQARWLVGEYKRAGYDFIKVYTDLDADVWSATVDEAQRRAIKVVGHVPSRVGLDAVLNSSQYTIEHCMGMGEACSPNRSVFSGEVSEEQMDALAGRVRESGIWNVPTIAVKLNSLDKTPALEARPEMRFVSPAMRQWFRDPRTLGPNRDITLYEANLKTVLRCLDRAGARLMLGVDSGFRYLLPGFSIHDELRLIVESGLSPYKALRMATVEPAVHLNRSHEMGTVEAGKIADFLLLEANPLEDVANAKKRAGVMLGGAWLDETWLRNRLEEIALSYTGRVEPVPTSFPQPPSSHAGG